MGITGIISSQYNYYKTQYTNSNTTKSEPTEEMCTAPLRYNLYIGNEESEDGKALGLIGFPDGSSTSVFKGESYTSDHPIFKVKTWDAQGNMTETEVDASMVYPSNASLQEMMALNANRKLKGETTFTDELMLSSGRLNGDETTSSYQDFFSKTNWISEMKDFMDMQYQLGNINGYLRYKKVSEILMDIEEELSNAEKYPNKKNVKNKENNKSIFSEAVDQFAEKVKDKIENGDASYQIGGQSFTIDEWNKLIEKIDEEIDSIKEEQKERIEKQEENDKLTEEQIKRLLTDYEKEDIETYG